MSDLARELADDEITSPEATAANAEFDASRVFDSEPIDPATEHNHFNSIRSCRDDVNALGILLAESKHQLQESIYYCNQKAWGYWDTNVGAPTSEQATALLDRMDTKFSEHARAARHLRALCADASAALEKAQTKAVEDMHARARKSQEVDDLAAFEAREKHRRFEEWKAARKS